MAARGIEKKALNNLCSELENSGIRVAVGDCSVNERRRWRPPYQTGKTVHVDLQSHVQV